MYIDRNHCSCLPACESCQVCQQCRQCIEGVVKIGRSLLGSKLPLRPVVSMVMEPKGPGRYSGKRYNQVEPYWEYIWGQIGDAAHSSTQYADSPARLSRSGEWLNIRQQLAIMRIGITNLVPHTCTGVVRRLYWMVTSLLACIIIRSRTTLCKRVQATDSTDCGHRPVCLRPSPDGGRYRSPVGCLRFVVRARHLHRPSERRAT